MSSIHRRSAFTLVELLVVIGLIGLLIGLMMPAIGRARLAASQVVCASQLRQIGQALFVYAADFQGVLPAPSGYQVLDGTGTGDDRPGLAWTEQLSVCFVRPDNRLYKCPEFPEIDHRVTYFLSARWSYVHGRGCLRVSDLKAGSRYLLVGECTRQGAYPPPFGTADAHDDDCDKDDARAESLLFTKNPGGFCLHPNQTNNVLFGDSHVAPVTDNPIDSPSYDPRQIAKWAEVN